MHFLLIEDNLDLASNICEYLEARGHVMDSAADGVVGMRLAESNSYDAIILDITLPGLDGLALCRRLRSETRKSVPVLMLTARDTLDSKLEGFAAGADDYLIKPFSLLELEARMGAVTRHARPQIASTLNVGDLSLDLHTREVRRAGEAIELTPACLKLLTLLMRASPGVVTRREIEMALWEDDPPAGDVLRAHVYALRSAIDKPFPTKLLHTVHATGYRLAPPDAIQP